MSNLQRRGSVYGRVRGRGARGGAAPAGRGQGTDQGQREGDRGAEDDGGGEFIVVGRGGRADRDRPATPPVARAAPIPPPVQIPLGRRATINGAHQRTAFFEQPRGTVGGPRTPTFGTPGTPRGSDRGTPNLSPRVPAPASPRETFTTTTATPLGTPAVGGGGGGGSDDDKGPRYGPGAAFRPRGAPPGPWDNRYGFGKPSSQFQVGMIISIAQHTPDWRAYPPANANENPYITISKDGKELIFTKIRKMLIIKRFFNHCVAVPFYTHEGNGIKDKPYYQQQEYIGIVDTEEPRPLCQCFAPHGEIFAKRAAKYTGANFGIDQPHYFKSPGYAWFDAPVTISYTTRFIWEGTLDDIADMKKVLRLTCAACVARKKVADQHTAAYNQHITDMVAWSAQRLAAARAKEQQEESDESEEDE